MSQKLAKNKAAITKYSRWVRLYTSTRNDPKILRLSPEQRWDWMVMLMLAGETDDGFLPPVSDLAIEMRCTREHAQQAMDEFVLKGLLDIDYRTGQFRPHNWLGRQFKSDQSGAERMRRHRCGKRHGDDDVTSQNGKRDVSALSMSSVYEEDRHYSSQEEGYTLSEQAVAREVRS